MVNYCHTYLEDKTNTKLQLVTSDIIFNQKKTYTFLGIN